MSTASSKFSLLCYDIPESSAYGNPSNELRRIALRFQYSCWMVSNDNIPYPLIREMMDQGCVVDLFPQPESNWTGMCQVAIRELEKDLQKRLAAERKTVEDADREYDRVSSDPESAWSDIDAARIKRDRARERAAITTERMVADMEHALRSFNVPFDVSHFSNARRRVRLIRSLQGKRADEYVKLVESLRAQGGQSADYATVAQEGGVPAGVLLDMAEDAGVDTTSAREAFAETAPAAPETLPAPVVTRTPPQPLPTPPGASQVPQNGSHTAPAGSHAPRRFEVRNRNGFRARISTYTDREAALLLREANDTFARSLARQVLTTHRPLTETQRAWLHVLAVELESE